MKNKNTEIEELHPDKVWEYIPCSQSTTADLISKVCNRRDLEKVIRGPEILLSPRKTWLKLPNVENKEEINLEKVSSIIIKALLIKNPVTSCVLLVKDPVTSCVLLVKDPVIDITRFSSWKKLFPVTA